MKVETTEGAMMSLKEEYLKARAEYVAAVEAAKFNMKDPAVVEANIRFCKLKVWKNRDPWAFK
jgi:hypothetical protein